MIHRGVRNRNTALLFVMFLHITPPPVLSKPPKLYKHWKQFYGCILEKIKKKKISGLLWGKLLGKKKCGFKVTLNTNKYEYKSLSGPWRLAGSVTHTTKHTTSQQKEKRKQTLHLWLLPAAPLCSLSLSTATETLRSIFRKQLICILTFKLSHLMWYTKVPSKMLIKQM